MPPTEASVRRPKAAPPATIAGASAPTIAAAPGDGVEFRPVSRRTVTDEIRADLAARIVDGSLPAGSQMPSERLLCQRYGVARTSVREAMQGLVSKGLIERRGNRTYVAGQLDDLDLSSGTRQLVPAELFETRFMIESALAELAAQRATPAARAELVRMAAALKPSMPWIRFHEANEEFHWAIARASGNSLLVELYGKVLDAFARSGEFASFTEAPPSASARREVVAASGVDHQALAAAISAGKGPAARSAAARHLRKVEAQMVPLLP
jgi:DNA-binding FadR family transcriptional regulator